MPVRESIGVFNSITCCDNDELYKGERENNKILIVGNSPFKPLI